jgi:N-dimethylarginine dimethylaminohydrolase
MTDIDTGSSALHSDDSAEPCGQQSLVTRIHNYSETSKLQTTLLGRGDTAFTAPQFDVNCTTIQRAIDAGLLPPIDDWDRQTLTTLRDKISGELNRFKTVLETNGVTVFQPAPRKTQEQMFPRDPIIAIGDKLVVARMKEPSRKSEYDALSGIFRDLKEGQIIVPPEDIFLEGGDVLVHDGNIFVGIGGHRTSSNAVYFLRDTFPKMKVFGLELASADAVKDVLHLDCCLNFVGRNAALMYKDGFKNPSQVRTILDSYDIIDVCEEEQLLFGTNVFSISPELVVSRPYTPEVNGELRKRDISVSEINFEHLELFGGSARCATHSTERQ